MNGDAGRLPERTTSRGQNIIVLLKTIGIPVMLHHKSEGRVDEAPDEHVIFVHSGVGCEIICGSTDGLLNLPQAVDTFPLPHDRSPKSSEELERRGIVVYAQENVCKL